MAHSSPASLQRFASSRYASIGAPVVAFLLVASVVVANVRGLQDPSLPMAGTQPITTVDGVPIEQLPPTAVVEVDPATVLAGTDAGGDPQTAVAAALSGHDGVRSVRPVFGDWYALEGVDGATAQAFAGVLNAQDRAYGQLSGLVDSQWYLENAGPPTVGLAGAKSGADIDWARTQEAVAPEAPLTGPADGSGVVVAVLDDGVDPTHEAFDVDRIWNDPDCGGADCYGYDFVDPLDADSPRPLGAAEKPGTRSHGTLIAGAIAASGAGSAPTGVAPGATIMPMIITHATEPTDGFPIDLAADAIVHAANKDADVINLSWSTEPGVPVEEVAILHDAIAYAGTQGAVVVAAAGNKPAGQAAVDLDEVKTYPAGFTDLPNLISVAASTAGDELSPDSNYGPRTVDLVAPGTAVWGAKNDGSNGYATVTGTSMAAALTSGVVAQVIGALPSPASAEAVRTAVLDGATRLLGLEGVRTSARLSSAGALGLPPSLDGGLVIVGNGFEDAIAAREFVGQVNVRSPADSVLEFTLGTWHDGAVHAVVGHDFEVSANDYISSVGGPSGSSGLLAYPDEGDGTAREAGRNFTITSMLPTGRYVLFVEETAPTVRAGFLTFYVGDPVEEGDLDFVAPGDGDGTGEPGDETGTPGDGTGGGDTCDPADDPECDPADTCDTAADPTCDDLPESDTCAEGYVPNDDGTACVPQQQETCAAGYELNGDGTACVPEQREDCASGYELNDAGDACVQSGSEACATGYELAEDGTCVLPGVDDCAAGYVPNGDGTCVLPGLEECASDNWVLEDGACLPSEAECPSGTAIVDGVCEVTFEPCPDGSTGPDGGPCTPVVEEPDGEDGGGAPATPHATPILPAQGTMDGGYLVHVRGEWEDDAWTDAEIFFNEKQGIVHPGAATVRAVVVPSYSQAGAVHVSIRQPDGTLLQAYEYGFTYLPSGGAPTGPGSEEPPDETPDEPPADETPDPDDETPDDDPDSVGGGGDDDGSGNGDTVGEPTTLDNGLTVVRFGDDHPLSRLTLAAWGEGMRCGVPDCRAAWIDTRPAATVE